MLELFRRLVCDGEDVLTEEFLREIDTILAKTNWLFSTLSKVINKRLYAFNNVYVIQRVLDNAVRYFQTPRIF